MTVMTVMAAICAGLAVFALAAVVLTALQNAAVDQPEEKSEIYRVLPLSLRLGKPFSGLFRGIARGANCAGLRERTAKQLAQAGYAETVPAEEFVALRIFFWLFGVAALLYCASIGQLVGGVLLGAVTFIYPGLWLYSTIKARRLAILKALPNVLDLLTLSVESGKDFITSLRDILSRRKMDALGEELMRAFHEIQLGRKRSEALREMAQRADQAELTSVVNAIVQAEELGVSIGQLLRIQGDLLRNKRFSLAEKLANEAPVKIIVPIVLFIFPSVLLILIAPIAMQALKMFNLV